jgi:hypothetical protein
MYDKAKIIPGLVIFLLLATFPTWYSLVPGRGAAMPEVKLPAGGKQCVMPATYMREFHMTLLNEWRDEAVRDGRRPVVKVEGVEYRKSLSGSCVSCHSNKSEFCDRCHSRFGVAPSCWDCHTFSKEKERSDGI